MAGDRRRAARVSYRDGHLPPLARIRPGRPVVVVDLSSNGALVEGPWRFRPGSRVEFLVKPEAEPLHVAARVLRCFVARLGRYQAVRYRAALSFERPIVVPPRRELLDGYQIPGSGAGPRPKG